VILPEHLFDTKTCRLDRVFESWIVTIRVYLFDLFDLSFEQLVVPRSRKVMGDIKNIDDGLLTLQQSQKTPNYFSRTHAFRL
jgi:hypothetical protein